MNECHITTKRKARKEHRCSECRGIIRAGESYTIESGIQDGPFAYKFCTYCHPMFEEANDKSWKDNGEGVQFQGGLFDDVMDDLYNPERMRDFIRNMVRRQAEVHPSVWKRLREGIARRVA